MPPATAAKKDRPRKPRKDYPLFPHATGRRAKKVRGKFVYFGKVADDPKGEAALLLWLDRRDDLLAGRTPRGIQGDGLTMRDLANPLPLRQAESARQPRAVGQDLARLLRHLRPAIGVVRQVPAGR